MSEKRYVRNRTGQAVFLSGHGVVPSGDEGVDVAPSEAVDAAVNARVLEDTPRPTTPPKTSKQLAADEATGLGIDFEYDAVTEADLRQLINDKKEGGS